MGYCQTHDSRWRTPQDEMMPDDPSTCPWCRISELTLKNLELSQINLSQARGFIGLPHAKTATSKAAAESMVPYVETIKQRVWEYIHQQGGHGATAQEIEDGLGIAGNTIRPRLVELRRERTIETNLEGRPTRSGRQAVIWIAVDEPDD